MDKGIALIGFTILLLNISWCSASGRSVTNHSFALPDAVVKHIELDLTVDFDRHVLDGSARIYFNNITGTDSLCLDTRGLDIRRVTMGDDDVHTTYTLGDSVDQLGRPLIVAIDPDVRSVTVWYETSPAAEALQWLDPEQTAGKQKPFLYTQSESILARTWVPCQDNPGVRFTYRAKVRVPDGMMALMSANNPEAVNTKGVYEFFMPHPIPSYLLALGVGDLTFRPIGERCGVYADPAVADTAAWEFADTEKMIHAAEELYGPYRWGRYDILVLPPSFPFEGMENPELTFATPTLLAGDRSLVSVIAHELAHSWSGNLVTNATWDDFWLNEGFTVYFERRIIEELYGKQYAQMLSVLGYQDLMRTFGEMGVDSADTRLKLSLEGRNPDDAASKVAYEKGYLFLRTIEDAVGRTAWDTFLKGYFTKFAFQSMTTEKFLSYLDAGLLNNNEAAKREIDIRQWVYATGLPGNVVVPRSVLLEKVDIQLQQWVAGSPAKDLATGTWGTQEWLHFLKGLPDSLSQKSMKQLDDAFGFTHSGNAQIRYEWFLRVVHNDYTPSYPALEDFLMHIGRRLLIKLVYAELAGTPGGRQWALRVYAKARPGYHSVTRHTLDKILQWDMEDSTK